jgi:hypothetical protein
LQPSAVPSGAGILLSWGGKGSARLSTRQAKPGAAF